MYFLENKLKKAVVLSLIFFKIVTPFDVKVLLQRCKMQDSLPQSLELTCPDGFIVSYNSKFALGNACPHKKLIISHTDDVIKINGKVLSEKILYIFPKLSHAIELQLKSQVSYWFESHDSDIKDKLLSFKDIFEEMLVRDNPLSDSYNQQLVESAKLIFNQYGKDVQENHTELEQYQELLDKYSNEFLDIKFMKSFVQALEDKHVTAQYRKVLLKNKNKSQEFFSDIICKTVEELLCEFLYALPRKIVQCMVQDKMSMIEYDGTKYQGSFIIFHDKKQFLLINSLDINDYLLSVVRYEGYPGWPIEMNKVVAITCRTYLVYQVLQAQKIDRAYHIENKNNHQTYKGYHDCPKIRQAIEETKNMILGHNGRPACAMYDICCGGVIPNLIDDQDLKKNPYLARNYACTFCKNYKFYNWSFDFSHDELFKRLKKEFPKIEKINDIQIYKKDKAGLARKIMITADTQKIIITEKKMKSLFPEMKSYCFDIKKIHKKYSIEGRGFGHHRGLCQWGAYHLVHHQHWNFVQVLQFYYPGISIMKLNY